jgi:lipopolysaccharide transport system ATP-binding protein
LGDPITTFDTADLSMNDREGDAFIVHVDSLLLRPGHYRLDVALVAEDRVVEDHVEMAAMFDVEPGLINGRSISAASGFGSISLPHRWTIRS